MRLLRRLVFAAVTSAVIVQTSYVISGVGTVRKALLDHVTRDGTTVAEVLEAAETARAREFRLGPEMSNGEFVTISYWIGYKREPTNLFSDITFLVTATGGSITFAPIHTSEDGGSGADALEGGLASFLTWVDGEYARDCRDGRSRRRYC